MADAMRLNNEIMEWMSVDFFINNVMESSEIEVEKNKFLMIFLSDEILIKCLAFELMLLWILMNIYFTWCNPITPLFCTLLIDLYNILRDITYEFKIFYVT